MDEILLIVRLLFSTLCLYKLRISLPVIKVCNCVLSLACTYLTANRVIRRMFGSSEKNCLPREIKSVCGSEELPLSVILAFETVLRQTSDLENLLSFNPCLSQRVSEFHGPSYRIRHSEGWRSCTFTFVLDFVTMTQNPAALDPRSYGGRCRKNPKFLKN